MLRSLLHYTGNTFLILASATALFISLGAHSDSNLLTRNDYLLEEYQANQQAMNILWFEQGIRDASNYSNEKSNYSEGGEALQTLVQIALKKSWHAVVNYNQDYDRYTPIVNGHFANSTNDTHYDLSLTGNTIKMRFSYLFN